MSLRFRSRIATGAALIAGLLSTACDVHTPTAPGTLQRIVVSPTPTLKVGATQQFVAMGEDYEGATVAITPVWTLAAGGGTITSTGLFTAGLVPGVYPATVTATSGGLTGTSTVTVVVGDATTLTVTPNPDTLGVGSTRQFTVVATDAGGNVVTVTPAWSTGVGGGTISPTGLFTAGTVAGSFPNLVTATSGTMTASATVVVTGGALTTITLTPTPTTLAGGGTQQFTAVGRDANGNVVAITPTWSVVNSGGTIGTTGLFTAGTVSGTFTNTVRVTSGAISANGTVIVSPGALTSVTVLPNPVALPVGTTQQFTAIGRDGNGNVIAITPTWSVINGGGTISASGLFTAAGVAGVHANTVRAVSGTSTGTASVTVTAAAPAPIIGLGVAGVNGIAAGQSVTCVTGGIINADVSVSPGNTVTGFGPCVITGTQQLGNAAALAAQNAMTSAYNTGAGLPCPPANAIVANLGGTTKAAGVYCTASGINVTGTLTLDGGGDPNATFVFQAGTSLITAGDIVLINGAQAKNVFWIVGTSATLGTASQWQGTIIALTSITMVDNATLFGRALARNGSVTLGTNNVIILP
ncbi:MAG: ice-binding family protein [Gemmatimonadales bacterium]|nr:ice-binding family protein [Gemmatimonadales bacterium]